MRKGCCEREEEKETTTEEKGYNRGDKEGDRKVETSISEEIEKDKFFFTSFKSTHKSNLQQSRKPNYELSCKSSADNQENVPSN